ncbi:hypothetical protein GCM10018782_19330 [Streptomyces griseoaurantiacus]|jgi:hypothetical protein|nr:hypothetical protein GCM10018782_19330 [Streptomyces griseoaurantiacus]
MSSIVLLGFLVSVGRAVRLASGSFGRSAESLAGKRSWLETDSGKGVLRSTGLVRRSVTAVGVGTYPVRPRERRRAARNLVADPGVLFTDDRAPSSRGGGGEQQRDGN